MFVYIREAHPSDSNWADQKLKVADPRTQVQRNQVATRCAKDLSFTLPMVIDNMKDTVNQLYRAWPERMYVIDRDGKIAFKGGIGPFGFKPAEAEAALKKLLDSDN